MIRFGFITEEHADDPLKVLEALRHLFKWRFKDPFLNHLSMMIHVSVTDVRFQFLSWDYSFESLIPVMTFKAPKAYALIYALSILSYSLFFLFFRRAIHVVAFFHNINMFREDSILKITWGLFECNSLGRE